MSLWFPIMILPVWELGLLFDAKEASEKARKRKSYTGICCIWIVVSWCFFASWRTWLAVMNVVTVAVLTEDCNMLSLLDMSGRVCTAAHWRLATKPRKACLSVSVTAASVCLSSFSGNSDWLNGSNVGWLLHGNGSMWELIHFNSSESELFYLLLPQGYFFSRGFKFWEKYWLPPQIPSSTCSPKTPSNDPVSWWYKMNLHESKGLWANPSFKSSSETARNHWYGASMSP